MVASARTSPKRPPTGHVKAAARPAGSPSGKVREIIRQRGVRCAVCGATEDDSVTIELDHVTPMFLGGDNLLANAQWLCEPHHRAKTRRESAIGKEMAKARES